MAPVPKLVLSYFQIGGRAEPVRLACVIGKVAFTNQTIEFKNWATVKSQYPLGRVPLLEIEPQEQGGSSKVAIGQSQAILRFVGKLGNLYPTNDPIKAAQIDSFIDATSDAVAGIELSFLGPVRSLLSTEEWSEDEKLAMRKRLVTDQARGLPYYLLYFEQALVNNSIQNASNYWLVGDSITIADLCLHRITSWIGSGILSGIPADLVDQYPALKKHYTAIEALPEVLAFRKKYPTPYTTFDYVPDEDMAKREL
ncbi:hypothetical protein ACA910_006469 [Epithemia clementina (nom. ined.)]